ncbi:MAG TPA: O-antigen ligase family protein [Methylophilaceae bacterium]|nr:O-antigen ligase family protein [Methylophilaceae bacterium]
MTTMNSMQSPFQPLTFKPLYAKKDTRPRLSMSDYFLLGGFWLALFYVADPLMMKLDKIGLTKHIPLFLCLGGIMLANIGAWLFPPREPDAPKRKYWQIFNAALPLVLLGIWIVVGSWYTREFGGTNNTFITVGLYMLFTVFVARMTMLSPARETLIRSYLLGAVIAGVFMTIRMLPLGWPQINYHELEAMIVPLAVYFALRPGNRHWKAFWTLFFLAAGLVFQKNTGFLVLVLTLLYIWVVEWRFRFRESTGFKFWTMLWVVVIVVAGLAAYGFLAYQRGEWLPSGNPQYRMLTYEKAWNSFLESPIWGTSFTEAATKRFTAFQILAARGILATHSDLLDLAAQGGIIALLLWLWSYIRIGRVSLQHVLRGRVKDDTHAAAHTFACMSLGGIIVYAFNPILLQPAKALLHWSQIGLLLGLALYFGRHAVDMPKLKKKLRPIGQKLALVPYYKNRKNNGYPIASKNS